MEQYEIDMYEKVSVLHLLRVLSHRAEAACAAGRDMDPNDYKRIDRAQQDFDVAARLIADIKNVLKQDAK